MQLTATYVNALPLFVLTSSPFDVLIGVVAYEPHSLATPLARNSRLSPSPKKCHHTVSKSPSFLLVRGDWIGSRWKVMSNFCMVELFLVSLLSCRNVRRWNFKKSELLCWIKSRRTKFLEIFILTDITLNNEIDRRRDLFLKNSSEIAEFPLWGRVETWA